jgi:hypothetical protein
MAEKGSNEFKLAGGGDAALHNPILKAGSDDVQASRKLAAELGFSKDQINRSFPEEL